jgi:hypothetical protein
LKKLAIDLKDNYATVAAGGDFEAEYFMIDFPDFDSGKESSQLLDIAGWRFQELCQQADQITLAVPMRYSLAKVIDIDSSGIAKYGDEFVRWEALQQLPGELGDFRSGFNRLGESFDKKKLKYFFYAVPEDFIGPLETFASLANGQKPILQSEAIALYHLLNQTTNYLGFNAAISLETEGAALVLSHDGDFMGGRHFKDTGGNLRDEVMYYIMGLCSEELKPQLLICGDLSQIHKLGDLTWAEILKFELINSLEQPEQFATVAGLNLIP